MAVQVLSLCQQEDVAISNIAQVIKRDPVLAAKLLKVSNSAFYGVRYEVTTVDRAVSILGINTTLSLALSFSLVRKLCESRTKGFDHAAYWRRSVITAAAAKTLAGLESKSHCDELFLLGLLQDIGMLVLHEAIPATYVPLIVSAKGSHVKLAQLERETFNSDHAAVGAWLLDHWNLPEKFQLATASSHDPEVAGESNVAGFCRIGVVAGLIAEIWIDPSTATSLAYKAAIDLLGMSTEKFYGLLGKVAEAIPEATSDLDVNLGGEEAVNHLLDQAREALVVLNMQAQQQVHQIRELSHQDSLTAQHNRSYIEDILPQYFDAVSRSGQPLSVLFVDVDRFKNINDTYGHEAGDSVLVSMAALIRSTVRSSDIVARYGGDEFICLLPDTGAGDAAVLGEKLRAAIEMEPQKIAVEGGIGVTVSIGCATHSPKHPYDSSRHLMRDSDQALYAAKAAGRNKLVSADSLAKTSKNGSLSNPAVITDLGDGSH